MAPQQLLLSRALFYRAPNSLPHEVAENKVRTGSRCALLGKGKLADGVGTVGRGPVRVQEETGRELRMWTVDRLLRTGKTAP